MEKAELMAAQGKIVVMSALSGSFQRKPFNDVLDLIPKAEKIKYLNAICKICSGPAAFSMRTVLDDRVELIGGEDSYIPVCRECFNFKTRQQEAESVRTQLEVIKFKGDTAEETTEDDSLLVVHKTPGSKGTPGQAGADSSLSSIEKCGSNNTSPLQQEGEFSMISD